MTHHTDTERAEFIQWCVNDGCTGDEMMAAHIWDNNYSEARAWKAARRAPVVPQGWKLVPIEATQEMVDAWSSATELPEGVAEQADDVVNAYAARRDWKAMLAASPETKACYAATQPAAQRMEKDAERYRLRLETIRALYPSAPSDIELDTAIDAALAAQAKHGGV